MPSFTPTYCRQSGFGDNYFVVCLSCYLFPAVSLFCWLSWKFIASQRCFYPVASIQCVGVWVVKIIYSHRLVVLTIVAAVEGLRLAWNLSAVTVDCFVGFVSGRRLTTVCLPCQWHLLSMVFVGCQNESFSSQTSSVDYRCIPVARFVSREVYFYTSIRRLVCCCLGWFAFAAS